MFIKMTMLQINLTIGGLPSGSNVFERINHNQIATFIETCLNPYLCGYRKCYNVQHALIALIKKVAHFS